MVLFIDNYDSFTYNLVQLAGAMVSDIKVVRNDAVTVSDVQAMKPDHIIISPGPGYPKDAGISEQLIRELKDSYTILGVCLGHQAICEVMGAKISHAKKLMHGKQSEVSIDTKSKIFVGLPDKIKVARYHSLISDRSSKELKILAEDENGEVMAAKIRGSKVYGLQFHPESILTPQGEIIMRNFLNIN